MKAVQPLLHGFSFRARWVGCKEKSNYSVNKWKFRENCERFVNFRHFLTNHWGPNTGDILGPFLIRVTADSFTFDPDEDSAYLDILPPLDEYVRYEGNAGNFGVGIRTGTGTVRPGDDYRENYPGIGRKYTQLR